MTVSRLDQIPALLDRIHDFWFDVDHIIFDEGRGTVQIEFSKVRPKIGEHFKTDVLLKVNFAKSLLVEDTEKVRFYDLNEMHFFPADKTVVFTGGVPIKITTRVEHLQIEATQQL